MVKDSRFFHNPVGRPPLSGFWNCASEDGPEEAKSSSRRPSLQQQHQSHQQRGVRSFVDGILSPFVNCVQPPLTSCVAAPPQRWRDAAGACGRAPRSVPSGSSVGRSASRLARVSSPPTSRYYPPSRSRTLSSAGSSVGGQRQRAQPYVQAAVAAAPPPPSSPRSQHISSQSSSSKHASQQRNSAYDYAPPPHPNSFPHFPHTSPNSPPANAAATASGGAVVVNTNTIITSPRRQDILCGRGGSSNRHEGNLNFRELIAANKQLYGTLTKKQKMLLARQIVSIVRGNGGRFLAKKDGGMGAAASAAAQQQHPITSSVQGWCDIGLSRSLEKTSQALREKNSGGGTALREGRDVPETKARSGSGCSSDNVDHHGVAPMISPSSSFDNHTNDHHGHSASRVGAVMVTPKTANSKKGTVEVPVVTIPDRLRSVYFRHQQEPPPPPVLQGNYGMEVSSSPPKSSGMLPVGLYLQNPGMLQTAPPSEVSPTSPQDHRSHHHHHQQQLHHHPRNLSGSGIGGVGGYIPQQGSLPPFRPRSSVDGGAYPFSSIQQSFSSSSYAGPPAIQRTYSTPLAAPVSPIFRNTPKADHKSTTDSANNSTTPTATPSRPSSSRGGSGAENNPNSITTPRSNPKSSLGSFAYALDQSVEVSPTESDVLWTTTTTTAAAAASGDRHIAPALQNCHHHFQRDEEDENNGGGNSWKRQRVDQDSPHQSKAFSDPGVPAMAASPEHQHAATALYQRMSHHRHESNSNNKRSNSSNNNSYNMPGISQLSLQDRAVQKPIATEVSSRVATTPVSRTITAAGSSATTLTLVGDAAVSSPVRTTTTFAAREMQSPSSVMHNRQRRRSLHRTLSNHSTGSGSMDGLTALSTAAYLRLDESY